MSALACRCDTVDAFACPVHKPITSANFECGATIEESVAELQKRFPKSFKPGRCSHHFAPDVIGGPCTICGTAAATIATEPPAPDDNLPRADPTKPRHYKDLNPEPIDVIAAWGLGFNLGCVV